MKTIIKSLIRQGIGDYEVYRIYRVPLPGPEVRTPKMVSIVPATDPAVLLRHSEPKMRSAYGFCVAEAQSWFATIDQEVVGVCSVWDHKLAYSSLPCLISEEECVLINIVTASEYRGFGIAPALIAHQGNHMFKRGFTTMYCWIWWNNWPSIRAFEKAGWHRCGWFVSLSPFWKKNPSIIRLSV